jgi:UDP-2,3-diacylglucosamine pyrophosphatase LpxH
MRAPRAVRNMKVLHRSRVVRPSIHPPTGIAAPPGESLLVLSDVHLGSDLNDLTPPETRIRRAREVDQDLVRLLTHYRSEKAPDGRWRLVIAGDFIDFIGMTIRVGDVDMTTPPNDEEQEFGLGNAEDHAREKMRRVGVRHADVFDALAAFVAAGHAVTLVHGNHDLELHWDGVRDEFVSIVREHALMRGEYRDGFEDRISFQPWFYYVDGVAYIEHGHQYDAYCATDHVMAPQSPLDPRRIARGFCDVLLRRVVRPTPGVREHGHESMGIGDYLMLGARLGLTGMFKLGARFFGAVVELFRLRRQHLAEAGRVLREEHERRVALLSEATRIGADRLRAIAALQAPPITRSIRGILASVLLDRLALGLLCTILLVVAGTIAAHHSLKTGGHLFWPLPVSVIVGWAIAHRELTRARNIDPTEVLADRAAHLAKLFPVAFVVMGHTHIPQQISVSPSATYINVGAWAEEEQSERAPRTHLIIRRGEAGPIADLLTWDTESALPRRYERP